MYDNLFASINESPQSLQQIISILKETLSTQDGESQNSIAKELLKVVSSNVPLDEKAVIEMFGYLMTMMEQWNEKSSEAWLDLFSAFVTRKQFVYLEKEALNKIIRLSDSKQILPIKIVAVTAFGYLVQVMKTRAKGTMLDRIRSFCRDPQKQIRLTLLKSTLPRLYQSLPTDLLGIYFSQRIFEMVYDSDQTIKAAALICLFKNCEYFSPDEKESRITNIFLQHLQSDNENSIVCLSAIVGQVYVKVISDIMQLRQYIEKSSKNNISFIKSLKSMASSTNIQILSNLLFNLPGLLYYLDLKLWSEIKSNYTEMLNNNSVKALALLVFHQIVQICGFKNFKQFPEIFLNLLSQLNQETERTTKKEKLSKTYTGLLDNMDLVINAVHRQIMIMEQKEESNESLQQLVVKITEQLMRLLEFSKEQHKHYIMLKIHKKIESCMPFLNIKQLQNQYVPLLIEQISCLNYITLEQCIVCFCQVVMRIPKKQDTYTIIQKIHEVFYKGGCWKQRYVFLVVASHLIDHFSFAKYRQHKLFETALSLHQDRVAEVRAQCVRYVESAYKKYSPTSEEADLILQVLETLRKDEHLLVVESLKSLDGLKKMTEEQQSSWKFSRQIRNQERTRQEEILAEENNREIEAIGKTNILLNKKILPLKQKKQYSSKYASRLKAKINISLSTNSLRMHQLNRLDKLESISTKEKISQTRDCKSANKDILIEAMTRRNKQPSIIEHMDEPDRIRIRKKPSIDSSNYKEFIKRDSLRRTSVDSNKKKRNFTDKKIQ